MGTMITNQQTTDASAPVRCPICAQPNDLGRFCRHVRWTFDQGDPIDFARFALETSPYIQARGHSSREIPKAWWDAHGEWVVEKVMLHLDAALGFVFGEHKDLDLLARDIWREFQPEPERPLMQRLDPV